MESRLEKALQNLGIECPYKKYIQESDEANNLVNGSYCVWLQGTRAVLEKLRDIARAVDALRFQD